MSPYILPGLKYKAKVPQTVYNTEFITGIVCKHYGMTFDKLCYRTRNGGARKITLPRMIAIYLLRGYTDASLKDIGAVFSWQCKPMDHTTVMNAINTVNDLMDTDPGLKEDINHLEKMIK